MYINLIKLIQQRILYPFIRQKSSHKKIIFHLKDANHIKDGHNDGVILSKHVSNENYILKFDSFPSWYYNSCQVFFWEPSNDRPKDV